MMKNNKNTSRFFYQGFLLWLLILIVCFILGAFDDLVLFPLVGNVAITITGLAMSTVVFIATWTLLPKITKTTTKNYCLLGVIWFILTFLFECMEAIVIESNSFLEIIEAYNPFLIGNLWIFVMLSVLTAPWIIAKIRKLIIEN